MSHSDSMRRKAERAQRQKEPPKRVGVNDIRDFFAEPETVARREDVVGLLLWIDRMNRKNVWWRRWARWVWLKIPFVPKPPAEKRRVNQDPLLFLHAMQARLDAAREVAGQEEPGLRSKPRILDA